MRQTSEGAHAEGFVQGQKIICAQQVACAIWGLQFTLSTVVLQKMNDCYSEAHLRQLGESAMADSDRRIASIPPELCGPFNIEAMRLEDELIRIYKMVVFCVREEADMEKVAAHWGFMVGMCDAFAEQLAKLKTAHPACGADSYYDRILDLRNKCHRLQEMHL